jgi:hypothetical protein
MQHRRTLTAAAFAAIFVATAWGTSARAEDPKPCVNTTFKFAKVKKACESGGQPAVKTLMKATVKKMKADGKDVNCKSCHTELKQYENKPNAEADLKGYL